MNLAEIDASVIDDRTKGIPGGTAPFALADIGKQGWNVLREDMTLPLAVLKDSVIEHNGAWMNRFLGLSGAVIAPHGKTTMSPQLFARQLAHGAWGITVGTIQQLQICRRFGFPRVLLANQLIGRQAIDFVLGELKRDPGFEFLCLVDGPQNVAQLAAAAREAAIGRPLEVLLEGGFAGGRTGARSLAEALEVARLVKAAEPYLTLRGVEGFEGLFRGATAEDTAGLVTHFLDGLVDIAIHAEREKLLSAKTLILSAGGSSFYDIVVDRFRAAGIHREILLIVRSGCYLSHDSAEYRVAFEDLRRRRPEVDALGPGLQAALEVWAYVQSRPEPGKVLLTMGKRDVSYDHLPVPLQWHRPGAPGKPVAVGPGHVVTGLNDQHCHMTVPVDSPLAVGDMVAFGVSHPCLTFDKWQVVPVVDDDYRVVSAIRTFF